MAKLTCHCLNAAVHVKRSTWNERAVDGARLFPANSGHRIGNATLYEVDLDVAGVTTEHSSLLLTNSIADWVVHTCSNCGNHIYITHREKNRVFVTGELMVSEAEISQVKGHMYYSDVFKITLNPNLEEEEEVAGRRRVSSMSFGRDDPTIKAAYSRVKYFLALEEEEMAARVRAFERREKETFARLRQKTYRERTLLFAAIAKAKEGSKPHSSSSSTSSPTKPLTPHSSHLSSPQSNPHKTGVTVTLSDSRPLVAKRSLPPPDDALFSLDGFDEFGDGDETDAPSGRGVAFPQSDDEEISTDDSSFRDLSSVQTSIACSVPLSIPMMKPSEQQTISPHDEVTHTDMAMSIKALALSVQDTGMFGDLPRPRVNSDA